MANIFEKPSAKDMVQKNVSADILGMFMEAYKANKPYSKRVWTLTSSLTLKQFREKIDPKFSKLTGARIISKPRKDSDKTFKKMELYFGDYDIDEWELSYEKYRADFEEGDVLDINTLLLCIESYDTGEVDSKGNPIIKRHLFATGEIK